MELHRVAGVYGYRVRRKDDRCKASRADPVSLHAGERHEPRGDEAEAEPDQQTAEPQISSWPGRLKGKRDAEIKQRDNAVLRANRREFAFA